MCTALVRPVSTIFIFQRFRGFLTSSWSFSTLHMFKQQPARRKLTHAKFELPLIVVEAVSRAGAGTFFHNCSCYCSFHYFFDRNVLVTQLMDENIYCHSIYQGVHILEYVLVIDFIWVCGVCIWYSMNITQFLVWMNVFFTYIEAGHVFRKFSTDWGNINSISSLVCAWIFLGSTPISFQSTTQSADEVLHKSLKRHKSLSVPATSFLKLHQQMIRPSKTVPRKGLFSFLLNLVGLEVLWYLVVEEIQKYFHSTFGSFSWLS